MGVDCVVQVNVSMGRAPSTLASGSTEDLQLPRQELLRAHEVYLGDFRTLGRSAEDLATRGVLRREEVFRAFSNPRPVLPHYQRGHPSLDEFRGDQSFRYAFMIGCLI